MSQVIDVAVKENQQPMTYQVITTEPKICLDFVEGTTGSCSETCITGDVDGTEEVSIKAEEAIDMKDEMPEAVKCSPIKIENEGYKRPDPTHYPHSIQPLKMEPTEGSETSAALKLMPGKYPKEDIQQAADCLFLIIFIEKECVFLGGST
jgi:hypothetical protein